MSHPKPGSEPWLDQVEEPSIDPARVIVDPHQSRSCSYPVSPCFNEAAAERRGKRASWPSLLICIQN